MCIDVCFTAAVWFSLGLSAYFECELKVCLSLEHNLWGVTTFVSLKSPFNFAIVEFAGRLLLTFWFLVYRLVPIFFWSAILASICVGPLQFLPKTRTYI